MTDTQRLNWLERQNDMQRYTGKCLFRMSTTGRGWRLHETSQEGAVDSVREAIDNAMISEAGSSVRKCSMEDSSIEEQMIKFESDPLIIRCWLSVDSSGPCNENNAMMKFRNAFSCIESENGFQLNNLELAKLLCLEFNMNACEVINKKTGCGGVFYREWP